MERMDPSGCTVQLMIGKASTLCVETGQGRKDAKAKLRSRISLDREKQGFVQIPCAGNNMNAVPRAFDGYYRKERYFGCWVDHGLYKGCACRVQFIRPIKHRVVIQRLRLGSGHW